MVYMLKGKVSSLRLMAIIWRSLAAAVRAWARQACAPGCSSCDGSRESLEVEGQGRFRLGPGPLGSSDTVPPPVTVTVTVPRTGCGTTEDSDCAGESGAPTRPGQNKKKGAKISVDSPTKGMPHKKSAPAAASRFTTRKADSSFGRRGDCNRSFGRHLNLA
jgi:hypothetical protein